jgi:hypothetical protein
MNNNAYGWKELVRKTTQNVEDDNVRKLKIANSKLASIEMIMDDYYTGSFTTIEELAGEISAVVTGTED